MGRPRSDPQRNQQIADMFRAGFTQREIGDLYGLGASRVGQILDELGVVRSEGGKAVAAMHRAERRSLDRLQKALGVPVPSSEAASALRLAARRFSQQRRRARQRGIGWELSFSQWWALWQQSGRWSQRGRSEAASAVMSRVGDRGPYAIGNVRITTLSANFVESWESAPDRIHGGRLKALREIA